MESIGTRLGSPRAANPALVTCTPLVQQMLSRSLKGGRGPVPDRCSTIRSGCRYLRTRLSHHLPDGVALCVVSFLLVRKVGRSESEREAACPPLFDGRGKCVADQRAWRPRVGGATGGGPPHSIVQSWKPSWFPCGRAAPAWCEPNGSRVGPTAPAGVPAWDNPPTTCPHVLRGGPREVNR